MLSILFKSQLIRHSCTRSAFKDTQRALEHLKHWESTCKLGQSSTCRALGLLEGTRALGGYLGNKALKALGQSETQGTRALKALRHLDTQSSQVLGHSGNQGTRALGHLGRALSSQALWHSINQDTRALKHLDTQGTLFSRILKY